MKNGSANSISSFRAAIRSAARAARKKAFRKGMPIAISRNGKVFIIYKDNTEIELSSPDRIKYH